MKLKYDLENGLTPLSEFRQHTKKYLLALSQGGSPLILTQNGHSAAVMLAPQDFERLEYERDLFRAIAEGEQDFRTGKTINHDELFKELLKA